MFTVELLVVASITRQFHNLAHFGEGQVKGSLTQHLNEPPRLLGLTCVGMEPIMYGQAHWLFSF
jgi:hypothetical protein